MGMLMHSPLQEVPHSKSSHKKAQVQLLVMWTEVRTKQGAAHWNNTGPLSKQEDCVREKFKVRLHVSFAQSPHFTQTLSTL